MINLLHGRVQSVPRGIVPTGVQGTIEIWEIIAVDSYPRGGFTPGGALPNCAPRLVQQSTGDDAIQSAGLVITSILRALKAGTPHLS